MRYIKTEHFVRKKTEEVIDNTNVTGVYGMFSRFNLPLFSRDLLPFLPIHLYQMATLWNITFSLAFAVFLRENHHHQLENFFFFLRLTFRMIVFSIHFLSLRMTLKLEYYYLFKVYSSLLLSAAVVYYWV